MQAWRKRLSRIIGIYHKMSDSPVIYLTKKRIFSKRDSFVISCLVFLIPFIVILPGCRTRDYPTFSAERAWAYLTRQCDFGVRAPGSEGYYKARDMFIEHFSSLADTVVKQPFRFKNIRSGEEFEAMNIIARFGLSREKRILLCAHYDTRPWADHDPELSNRNKPILGANDGASGVAILMHIAEILQKYPVPLGVDLILFDAEDSGISEKLDSYCKGSQFYAENPIPPVPQEGALIDMVGDANLSLPMERYSFHYNSGLVHKIWKIARERDFEAFRFQLGVEVYDDHVPLNEIAGIRVIDIIDFNYPDKYRNYWHTLEDTPDKCSPKSLAVVGQTLVDYIYSHNGKTKKGKMAEGKN